MRKKTYFVNILFRVDNPDEYDAHHGFYDAVNEDEAENAAMKAAKVKKQDILYMYSVESKAA